MYPTIYHALYDIFGLDWPWAKLLNSFGFFVALAFVAASYTLSLELKRKAKLAYFTPVPKTIITGGKPEWPDILTNAAIGFIIGWKFVYLFANSDELFQAGSTPQRHIFSADGYWLLGMLIGAGFGAWRWWEYRKRQLPEPVTREFLVYPHHLTGTITFMAAIFGILGAKLFHLLENPREFMDFFHHPSFNSFISGLTVYGGLIIGAAGVLVYAWFKKINLWHLCDSAAPGLILAYGVGRIGCQVSGDGDWGIANPAPKPGWLSWAPDWMWAYDFPNNVNHNAQEWVGREGDTFVLPITDPSVPCFEGYCTHLSPPVFPTSFYETVACILIFLVLWSLRKRISVPCVIFSLYLVLNGIERFFIEKIRVNNKFDLVGMKVTQAEVIAVLFVITGIVIYIIQTRKSRKPPLPSTE
jgi:phosphatidylglycerol---prolipoprotein diacylglyceryl transferase